MSRAFSTFLRLPASSIGRASEIAVLFRDSDGGVFRAGAQAERVHCHTDTRKRVIFSECLAPARITYAGQLCCANVDPLRSLQ